ncbi:MAG TPA: NADH-quinone oxidoreductase subunit J [Coriobacteriia bacterium]|jgi:NADH-quinone oxidoreductase subunit J
MPEVNAVAFVVLAALTLGGAVMMMLTPNVVHAAFWLLEVLVATAGLYLVLSAEFIALVQIMVYAGAVSVLVLFVIMLTLRRREDAERPRNLSLPVAAMAAIFAAVVAVTTRAMRLPAAAAPAKAPAVAEFGHELFTRWTLPFEIASGVLLVALVGAVWWAGRGEDL